MRNSDENVPLYFLEVPHSNVRLPIIFIAVNSGPERSLNQS